MPSGRFVEVDPKTVCEYTGTSNKFGGKAFSGDITKDGVIVFSNYFLGFFIQPNYPSQDDERPLFDCLPINIIGNIFDDPELLNE